MGGTRKIYLTGLATILGLLLGGVSQAQAVDIIANPECCTFAPGPYAQAQGETSTLVNQGGVTGFHNVTAVDFGPDRQPLFSSETIGGSSSTPVLGTEYLATGTYAFVCTLHPGMNGNLEVTGAGAPAPRPGVKLAILAQKLKQVRKSGKVKVKVTPTAPSTGVAIELRKGSKLIGEIESLDLTAAKTVPVKLDKAGRKAIAKGKTVKLSVSATVPFGNLSRASRVLR